MFISMKNSHIRRRRATWFCSLIICLASPAFGQVVGDAPKETKQTQSTTQPSVATLSEMKLKYLGTIKLETTTPPPPTIRDILDWNIDDQGRIGFYRIGMESSAFVLVDSTGQVLTEIPLYSETQDLDMPRVRSLSDGRWFISANEKKWDGHTKIWLVASDFQSVLSPFDLDRFEPDALATDHRGGFVGYKCITTHQDGFAPSLLYGQIVAYDGQGKERWRTSDKMKLAGNQWPYSASIAITSDDKIALCEDNNECFRLFDENGKFQQTVQSGNYRSCFARSLQIFADVAGGILITSPYGNYADQRVRLDDNVASISVNPLLAARTFERPPSAWGYDFYLRSKIKPEYADGRMIGRIKGARIDRDGRVWICDGEAFLRLDACDVVDCVIGEEATDDILRKVGERRIDQQGRTYLTSQRTASVHVFDETGKRLEVIPVDQQAIKMFGLRQMDLPQPQGGRSWRNNGDKIFLIDDVEKIIRTIPEDTKFHYVQSAAVGPDGALAVIDVSTVNLSNSYVLHIYDKDGKRVRTMPVSIDGMCGQIAFDGKNVVVGTGFGKSLHIFDVQGGKPRKVIPKDSGSGSPSWRDGWSPFFSKEYRELWLLNVQTRLIERYEAP